MTSIAKVLIPHQRVEASATLKYTSPPSGNGSWIDKFTGTNTTAGPETMSVWLVPSGGARGDDNLIVQARSIAANGGVDLFPEVVGKFLNPGDSIHWDASTAASITGGANGRELTQT